VAEEEEGPVVEAPEPEPSAPEAAAPMSGIEVHPGVACDGCSQAPILGKRFKCLQCPDYDLCERCFKRNKVDMSVHPHEVYAQVQSNTIGDVVQSYYAPANGSMGSVHHNVICDGCDATPIQGSRFTCKTVPNYDLCGRCYEQRAERSLPHANEPFEELVVCPVAAPASLPEDLEIPQAAAEAAGATAAGVAGSSCKAMEEAAPQAVCVPELPKVENGSRVLRALAESMDEELCQVAVEALLAHPNARLRGAAAWAAAFAAAGPEEDELMPLAQEPAPLAPAEETAVPAAEAAEPELPEPVETPMEAEPCEEPKAPCSALAVSAAQLVLGVEAREDEGARGDCSGELQDALQSVGASQAFRVGRALLPCSAAEGCVPAEAKVVLANDGPQAWPEATALVLVAGDALGLQNMGLGAVGPGEAAEIILDLSIPSKPTPLASRSAWSLVDEATGSTFGPLLFFEVAWITP